MHVPVLIRTTVWSGNLLLLTLTETAHPDPGCLFNIPPNKQTLNYISIQNMMYNKVWKKNPQSELVRCILTRCPALCCPCSCNYFTIWLNLVLMKSCVSAPIIPATQGMLVPPLAWQRGDNIVMGRRWQPHLNVNGANHQCKLQSEGHIST